MKNTIKLIVVVAFTLAAMSVSAQVKLGSYWNPEINSGYAGMECCPENHGDKAKDIETELTENERRLSNESRWL